MNSTTAALERNVDLFPRYKAAISVSPWLPIFFLYFIERVTLGEAVLLGSAYYFSVFLLEVPSGYCSDRFGRRPTLILASILTVFAYALFIVANAFYLLIAAQALLAAGIAFQSGSDSALLYDSLRALGRDDEYTQRETVAQKWSMTSLACSCLVGGALGMIDLRLAYGVALLAALFAVSQCIAFLEPVAVARSRADTDADADTSTGLGTCSITQPDTYAETPSETHYDTGGEQSGFTDQVKRTLTYFSHPLLGWVLAFYMIGFSLEHIPFEFYQPYLRLLGESSVATWLATSSAPMVSGIVISISMFGGAVGAAASQWLIGRIGLRALLLTSIAVQVIIVAGMSIVLHPVMLSLIMLRNFSMSMAHGPMLGAIAPHVESAQRATFLSMLSLAGRATFSIALALLSFLVIGEDDLNWTALSQVLALSAIVGVVALSALYLWSRRIAGELLNENY